MKLAKWIKWILIALFLGWIAVGLYWIATTENSPWDKVPY